MPLVGSLGVQVEIDPPSRVLYPLKHGLPERIAAGRDAALTVHAEAEAGDVGTSLQQRGKSVPAIGRVGFRREARNGIVRSGARPGIGVRPQRQAELHAALDGLAADEAKHFQIAIALGIRKVHRFHVVTRNGQQERIGEIKIGVRNVAVPVVAVAGLEIEAIEPAGGERGEIVSPPASIVVPGLVFEVAFKSPPATANQVGGFLHHRGWRLQRRGARGGEPRSIRQFEDRIHQPTHVAPARQQHSPAVHLAGHEAHGFRSGGERQVGGLQEPLGGGARSARNHHARVAGGRRLNPWIYLRHRALSAEGGPQFLDRPG